MSVAVCLQTCERFDYTARTIQTFLAMNHDRSRFDLIHGDDGSTDQRIVALAEASGFDTVMRSASPIGPIPFRAKLMDAARARGASWVLMLENDIESLRPFPWALFDFLQARPDVYCLRLFGAYKD